MPIKTVRQYKMNVFFGIFRIRAVQRALEGQVLNDEKESYEVKFENTISRYNLQHNFLSKSNMCSARI